MTKHECAIVMAYTGACMLSGEDFNIFHEYIEKLMGRPVWTHELADKNIVDQIKEKSKADFLELCRIAAEEFEMTKEEFKAKAKEIIDNEQFGCDSVLFDYAEIDQMKVAQVDNWGDLDSSMPFMNFIDELYEQIKGDLK